MAVEAVAEGTGPSVADERVLAPPAVSVGGRIQGVEVEQSAESIGRRAQPLLLLLDLHDVGRAGRLQQGRERFGQQLFHVTDSEVGGELPGRSAVIQDLGILRLHLLHFIAIVDSLNFVSIVAG